MAPHDGSAIDSSISSQISVITVGPLRYSQSLFPALFSLVKIMPWQRMTSPRVSFLLSFYPFYTPISQVQLPPSPCRLIPSLCPLAIPSRNSQNSSPPRLEDLFTPIHPSLHSDAFRVPDHQNQRLICASPGFLKRHATTNHIAPKSYFTGKRKSLRPFRHWPSIPLRSILECLLYCIRHIFVNSCINISPRFGFGTLLRSPCLALPCPFSRSPAV